MNRQELEQKFDKTIYDLRDMLPESQIICKYSKTSFFSNTGANLINGIVYWIGGIAALYIAVTWVLARITFKNGKQHPN